MRSQLRLKKALTCSKPKSAMCRDVNVACELLLNHHGIRWMPRPRICYSISLFFVAALHAQQHKRRLVPLYVDWLNWWIKHCCDAIPRWVDTQSMNCFVNTLRNNSKLPPMRNIPPMKAMQNTLRI